MVVLDFRKFLGIQNRLLRAAIFFPMTTSTSEHFPVKLSDSWAIRLHSTHQANWTCVVIMVIQGTRSIGFQFDVF